MTNKKTHFRYNIFGFLKIIILRSDAPVTPELIGCIVVKLEFERDDKKVTRKA